MTEHPAGIGDYRAIHAVALMAVAYVIIADNALRRIVRSFLLRNTDATLRRHLDGDAELLEAVVRVACDWGLRTAIAGFFVELIVVFGEWHKLGGKLLILVGLILLLGSVHVPVGQIFQIRLGPAWIPWRPTWGRVLQTWLVLMVCLLFLDTVRAVDVW